MIALGCCDCVVGTGPRATATGLEMNVTFRDVTIGADGDAFVCFNMQLELHLSSIVVLVTVIEWLQ
jgi:hypothetical protein